MEVMDGSTYVSAEGDTMIKKLRWMEEGSVTKFDVALVDGRFRLQCALKLLPYLHSESVLLMHDFWLRIPAYKDVLDYYYVIGYARSVVALKKKPGLSLEISH